MKTPQAYTEEVTDDSKKIRNKYYDLSNEIRHMKLKISIYEAEISFIKDFVTKILDDYGLQVDSQPPENNPNSPS